MESFNMRHIQKMGLTSKDVIGPTALTFERDHMIVGNTYARALMIVDLPTFLRGDILTELANMPFNMLDIQLMLFRRKSNRRHRK